MFFFDDVKYIRPPSILIGSAEPLSGSVGNAVRLFIKTFAESVLTRRTFVDFSYEQRNKYSVGCGHFVRKIFNTLSSNLIYQPVV